jgi:hypothetical protein
LWGQLTGHPLPIHRPGKSLPTTAPKCEDEVDGLIFQQDGAPAHFGAIVFTALYD